jgi:hypothetical protein
MGTNYYHHEKEPCPTCGHAEEGRHIGKSSAGWCFSLHVYPEDGINDLPDWQARWSVGRIVNEYRETISAEEMLRIVTKRECGKPKTGDVPWGYATWSHFYERNHAVPGPKNLLRHQLGEFCLKHGDGTWDCIAREFS